MIMTIDDILSWISRNTFLYLIINKDIFLVQERIINQILGKQFSKRTKVENNVCYHVKKLIFHWYEIVKLVQEREQERKGGDKAGAVRAKRIQK